MKKMSLTKLQIGAAAAFLVVLSIIVSVARIKAAREVPTEKYTYSNVTEQVLADEVTTYLQGAADLGEDVGAKTANEAVESYRLIIKSDVDTVNDEHTNAIQNRISTSLQESADETNLGEADITALSAGVAEIVWQTVLSQIKTVTDNVEESDYFYLAESLQGQIKELEERKMKVSIRANIKNNTEMTPDELLNTVEGMTDQELEELAKSMGLSLEELQKLLESYQSDTDKETDSKLKEMEEKLTREIRDNEGEDGKNGNDGVQGERGQEGKTGNTGASGKSVFIRYSEKANGESMTERPTAATKYMGTYTGAKASTNPSDYSWSKYVGNDGNSVFIRYATSENGANMTKTPNSDTKYMGTYIGAKASVDPEDYTWTRYSDATISFSNGTLYITQ
ncbi:MAG: hypothetical protein K1W31_03020 [Lachnospiraceae bacterium]